MKKILLTMIGFNPASALVSARAIKPYRTVLIHTPETKSIAEIVRKQIGEPCRLISLHGEKGILHVIETLASELRIQDDEWPVVDITGATKPIALGLWQYLLTYFNDRFDAVNVSQSDYRLKDALTWELMTDEPVRIMVREILAWHGGQVQRVKWESQLNLIPNSFKLGKTLSMGLVKALASNEYRNLTPDQGRNAVSVPQKYLPEQLPVGFSYDTGKLFSTIADYLQKNIWLEEFCLCMAADALEDVSLEVLASMGMDLIASGSGGGIDELDVVLVRGSKTVVIEAKARASNAGAGPDLQKRIQKVNRFFGPHAKIIMVHPAWGKKPPKALVNLTGKSAELVGADMDHFKNAVRKGLGL